MNQGTPVSELPDFLDFLERSGFDVTLQSRLVVHDLLVRLTVQGKFAGDGDAMRRMIGPILCTSPRDQQRFESLFAQWQNQTEPESGDQHVPIGQSNLSPAASKPRRRRRTIVRAGILVGLLLAAITFVSGPSAESYWKLASKIHRSMTQPTTEPDPGSPVEQGGEDQDSLAGAATDPATRPTPEAQSPTPLTDPVARSEQPSQGQAARDAAETDAGETGPRDAVDSDRADSVDGQPIHAGLPRYGAAAAVTAFVFALCCLAACVWWAMSARWRKRFLVKRSVNWQPEIEQIGVQFNNSDIGPGTSLVRTAQRFRRHLSRSSHRLDLKQTAARTAAKAGLFTPVRAQQKMSPSYLMLIENDGRDDQQTQMIDSLIDRLESEGVAVTRYYFRGDPRICRQRGGRTRKLADLSSTHDRDRLLVFADAKSFLDPITGSVATWVESFAAWDERALMVAAEAENWSAAESTMAEHFRLAAANQDGLSSLVQSFTPDPSLTPRVGDDHFPSLICEHPERWLDREPPTEELLNKLLDQLRVYLGNAGYEWLSSCAVYPTLHHHMTLWAGQAITDDDGKLLVNDSDLMRLSRLPWMRHGHLPDWLRARLIADLSDERELSIRNRLDGLFNSALEKSGSNATLPIARDTGGGDQKMRKQGRVLRDHTFVSFMSNPLSVRLPRALGGILPESQQWRPRKTLSTAAVLVAIYAASVGLLPWDAAPKMFEFETFKTSFHPGALSNSQERQYGQLRKIRVGIDQQTGLGERIHDPMYLRWMRALHQTVSGEHSSALQALERADQMEEADYVIQVARLSTPEIIRLVPGSASPVIDRDSEPLVSASDTKTELWLDNKLHQIVATVNLLEIANDAQASNRSDIEMQIELVRLRDADDYEGGETIDVESGMKLPVGTQVGVRISNPNPFPVDYTVLIASGQHQAALFLPRDGATNNRLGPAGTFMPVRFEVNDDTTGLESLVVIAEKTRADADPTDFRFLCEHSSESIQRLEELRIEVDQSFTPFNRSDERRTLAFRTISWQVSESDSITSRGPFADQPDRPVSRNRSTDKFRALLVGCSEYKATDVPSTPRAANDVLRVRDMLIKKYGFTSDSITVLSEQAGSQYPWLKPTRANIIREMARVVEANYAEDAQVVIYFSGHGGKQIDGNGDEEDRIDEVFCPSDIAFRSAEGVTLGGISDDEINDFLIRTSGRAAVWMIADFCFYDGLTAPTNSPNPIAVFCAAPNQTTLESTIDGTPRGTFTRTLCNQVFLANQTLSYRQLIDRIRGDYRGQRLKQIPELFATNEELRILGATLKDPPNRGRNEGVSQRRWMDAASAIHEEALKVLDKEGAEAAIVLEQRALDFSTEKLGQDHELTNGIRLSLAQLFQTNRDFEKAKAQYELTLEVVTRLRGPGHTDTAKVLEMFGRLNLLTGNYQEAVERYTRAYGILSGKLGDNHGDTFAALIGLAEAHGEMREFEKAEGLLRRALVTTEKVHGDGHAATALVCHRLARVLDARGDKANAEAFYMRALDIRRSVLGDKHVDVAHCLHDLAVMYGRRGNYEQARTWFQQALEIRTAALGEEHHQTIDSRNALSELPGSMDGQQIELPQQMEQHAMPEQLFAEPEQMQAMPEQMQAMPEQMQAMPEQRQVTAEQMQAFLEEAASEGKVPEVATEPPERREYESNLK